MFGIGDGRHAVHAIDNSSLLYSNREDLLSDSLPTPDSASKFDVKSTGADNAHLGLFGNPVDIFAQYTESGPSSVQYGEAVDTPEQEEPLNYSRNGLSVMTPTLTDWNGKDICSQSPMPVATEANIEASSQHVNSEIPCGLNSTGASRFLLDKQRHLGTTPTSDGQVSGLRESASSGTPRTTNGSLKDEDSSPKSLRPPPRLNMKEFRARSSIPHHLSWAEFGRQGMLAAFSSRLNPFALHPSEYQLLRAHLTKTQVTIYLNIRNGILRLFHRNPMVGVTRAEAAGCARDSRYFALSQVAYDWLRRNGYINFGCVELPNTAAPIPRAKPKGTRRKTIVVIGAGVSGLGCARQLEGLVAQLGEQFTESGERPPKVIVLEGRNRIGGRVYSHPLKDQKSTLPPGMRSTAEMGAQIITGFENGNPLNIIVRGQLGLRYHSIKDNTVLYDIDGKPVDTERDARIQTLWNDVLARACVYRQKPTTISTVKGDESMLRIGEDPIDSYNASGELISSIEDGDEPVTENNPLATNTTTTEHTTTGIEKLAGRQYQTAGPTSDAAAAMAKSLGFQLQAGVEDTQTVNLKSIATNSEYPCLGDALDEGIRQYHEMVGFTAQDFRLLHWHHANLEYSNAANLHDLSLSGWDQDGGNEFEGEHTKIIGGYTQLPRALWQLPKALDVRFQSAVKSITYSNAVGQPATIETTNGDTIEADRIVLTAPLGVLKEGSITFNPPLPEAKVACIQRMGFGLLNKVILVYKKRFWGPDRDGWGLLNGPEGSDPADQKAYDANRGRLYYFWDCTPTSGRPMLVTFMAGSSAHEAEATENSVIIDEVTTRLQQIFPHQHVPRPVESIITRWKSDPFSRGTYSYVGTKTQPGDYDIMAQPVGPIYFAGEATCGGYPATVHGAYISGLRAAAEVIDELLGPISVPTPLIERKIRVKNEQIPAVDPFTGIKRKRGYVDIWEPIEPVVVPDTETSNLDGEAEAYEARIIGAILAKLGDRPVKPLTASQMNPYLMYQKDEWYNVKRDCDAEKAAATGNPNAKAGREEIRVALGHRWRNAPANVKDPYVSKCDSARKELSVWNESVKRWDAEAARVREDFTREHPPPEQLKGRFKSHGTAIELNANGSGGRKVRKLS